MIPRRAWTRFGHGQHRGNPSEGGPAGAVTCGMGSVTGWREAAQRFLVSFGHARSVAVSSFALAVVMASRLEAQCVAGLGKNQPRGASRRHVA